MGQDPTVGHGESRSYYPRNLPPYKSFPHYLYHSQDITIVSVISVSFVDTILLLLLLILRLGRYVEID